MKESLKAVFPYVLVIVGVYVIYQKIFGDGSISSLFGGFGKKSAEDIAAEEEVKAIKVDYTRVKLDLNKLNAFADRLYEAMKGFGTDEKEIFLCLEGLNGEELKYVYQRFGVRGGVVFKGNLAQWFRDELGAADYKRVQELFSISGLF